MRESSHAIIQALLEQNRVLLGRIAALEAEVARLKLELAAAKKNSRNSSKPPSSDIVKSPPPSGKGRRHIGGQPGHEPHFRTAFTLERLDAVHTFNPPSMTCRHCGGELHATPVADQVRQQINLRPDPLVRREYRAPAYRCTSCGAFHRAKLPEYAARSGFVGDGLAAALVFLNAKGYASHSTLAAFMKDVLGEALAVDPDVLIRLRPEVTYLFRHDHSFRFAGSVKPRGTHPQLGRMETTPMEKPVWRYDALPGKMVGAARWRRRVH